MMMVFFMTMAVAKTWPTMTVTMMGKRGYYFAVFDVLVAVFFIDVIAIVVPFVVNRSSGSILITGIFNIDGASTCYRVLLCLRFIQDPHPFPSP